MAKVVLTQKEKIAKHLNAGKTLTAEQARTKFSVAKPSARIRELRVSGMSILSTKNRQGTPAWKLAA